MRPGPREAPHMATFIGRTTKASQYSVVLAKHRALSVRPAATGLQLPRGRVQFESGKPNKA